MIKTLYLIIGILIVYIFINIIPIKNKKNAFINVVFLVLLWILILRGKFSDMINYSDMFTYIGTLSWKNLRIVNWEYGFVVLNKLIYILTKNEQIFFSIISIITLGGQYVFIKKYSKNYLGSIILFIGLNFYNYNYILLRQEIAITIILFSIKYIENNNAIRFLFSVFLASLFHQSALVFIFIYPLNKIRCTNKLKIYMVPIFVFVYIIRGVIKNVIYIDKYVIYEGGVQSSDGYTMLMVLIAVYIAMLITEMLLKIKKEDYNAENVFWWMYIIAIVAQILATTQSIMARIVLYFNLSMIVLLPNTIEKIEDKNSKILINILLIIMILGFSFTNQPMSEYRLFFK